MPIVRRTDCVPLPMVVCPVIAVAMLESWVASCVQCVENVAVRQHSPHSEHSYNRTNIGSGTQSVLLTMGIKMPETC